MLKKLTIVLGVVCLSITVFLFGYYSAMPFGASVCGFEYGLRDGFYLTHIDPYFDGLSVIQRFLALVLIIFLVGKLFYNEILSQIISTPSIILAMLFQIEIYRQKTLYFDEENRYTLPIREFIDYDYAVFGILGTLIFSQIALIYFYIKEKKLTKVKTGLK